MSLNIKLQNGLSRLWKAQKVILDITKLNHPNYNNLTVIMELVQILKFIYIQTQRNLEEDQQLHYQTHYGMT